MLYQLKLWRLLILVGVLSLLSGCSNVMFQPDPCPGAVCFNVPPTTFANFPAPIELPRHIALLVPLKGPLASSGKAIKAGFLKASCDNCQCDSPCVEVIDTTACPSIHAAYEKALAHHADFVVGPMPKPDVQALVANELLPTTTLLLNYLNPDQDAPPNAFQFGLSPLDEAKQVVTIARQQCRQRVIIIVPRSEWGCIVAATFRKEWRTQGGDIADTVFYTNDNCLPAQISSAVQQHDFDAVFLAATPDVARQIRPLLRFYAAGDVPIYATSLIYSGTRCPKLDRVLDGIIFCDTPFILSRHCHDRLYAFGYDAYQVAYRLSDLALIPLYVLNVSTGSLHLDCNRRIVRRLVCAQFCGGVPVLLGCNTTE